MEFGESYKSEAIKSIQLNLYGGDDYCFENKLFKEGFKLVGINLVPIINEHDRPDSMLGRCPFSIIN